MKNNIRMQVLEHKEFGNESKPIKTYSILEQAIIMNMFYLLLLKI